MGPTHCKSILQGVYAERPVSEHERMVKIRLPCLALLLVMPLAAADDWVDRIWSAASEDFVDESRLQESIAAADIILLGEIHDNPRHHVLQARMIEWATDGARTPGIVLEMVGPEHEQALRDWQSADQPDPAALGAAVDWEQRGWPDWSIYQPIAETAIDYGLPLHAGAPDGERLRTVMRSGVDALSDTRRQALGLDRPLPSADRERLLARLEAAHCGLSDHVPLESMLGAQRLRDAEMARTLLDVQAEAGSAILIAGSEHVRRDYGVPVYLERLAGDIAEDITVVSVGLVPAEGLSSEHERPPAERVAAFDYAWLTTGKARTSPCGESS